MNALLRLLAQPRERVARLSSEMLAVVSGQVLGAVGMIVGTRLITEFVSPGVYAEARLVTGLVMLTYSLMFHPFCQWAMRGFPAAAVAGLEAPFIAFTRRSAAQVFLVSGALLALGLPLYLLSRGEWSVWLWLLALAGLGTTGLWNLERSLLVPARRQWRVGAMRIAELWGTPLATILAILIGGDNAVAFFVGWISFYFIGLGLYYGFGAPRYQPAASPPEAMPRWRSDALSYALPLVPFGLIAWVMPNGNRYILDYLETPLLGTFIVCFALASQPFQRVANMLEQFFRPIWYAAAERGNRRRIRGLLAAYLGTALAVSAAGLGLVYLLGDFLVNLVLAEAYREGALPIMLWVAAGYGFFAMAGVFDLALQAEKRTGALTLAYALAAAVTLALCVVLAGRHGVVGAAQATCFGFMAYLVLVALFYWIVRSREE